MRIARTPGPRTARRVLALAVVLAIECAAAAIQLAAPGVGGADESDRLVALDGSITSGQVTGMKADAGAGGRVQLSGSAKAVDLYSLYRIERTAAPVASSASAVVHLVGGGQIFARKVALTHDRFRICGCWDAAGQPLDLPIKLVRAVEFARGEQDAKPDPRVLEMFVQARERGDAREDQLFLATSESIQTVPGVLEEVGDKQLTFLWEHRSRTVDLAKAVGVVLAGPTLFIDRVGQCRVHLVDRSGFWARLSHLTEGRLIVMPAAGTEASLPWDAVVRLDVRSNRLTFCSDLDPARVVQQPGLTGPWSWRRDASVAGNRLRLGDKVYEHGLGMHADCRLDFRIGGRYDQFVATLGIDVETDGKGDCVCRVLGDGRELFRKRTIGTDPSVDVRVSVKDIETVSLVVEQGEDWDFADHVDWGDARLVRAE